VGKEDRQKHPFAGIPPALPALSRAQRIADKARRMGWTGENLTNRWDALLDTLETAITSVTKEEVVSEAGIGECLFALGDWARLRGLDAESALRRTSDQFITDFEQEE